ncbi:MAG: bifunctional 5,10-methylenetetrahydrofolate dehydrogenase/5,10-methenyltetrahydrofolate cyclohydrolase, partial [Turicibacter sp.]
MATIIDGKKVAQDLRVQISEETKTFMQETNIQPHLVVIIVGANPASQTYVRNKNKGCEEVGMKSTIIEMCETTSEEDLLSKIQMLNDDVDVHGILVQLPLPKHIDEQKVIHAIAEHKDVDGFHPNQVGRLASGLESYAPCTAAGVIELLKAYNLDIAGRHAVIVGRSHIVGKPLIQLLLNEHATVTVCHSKTKDLPLFTKMADILIVAIGRANFVTFDMVKPGATVIDVGINRLETGKLAGDVDYAKVSEVAGHITP